METTLPNQTEMDRVMRRRDASYDGVFFVCVRSTGIFCRPSCPARKPLARNVVYRATVRDCLLDGFRPCRRCRPLAVGGEPPAWLDALLDRVEQAPAERVTDGDVRRIGVDPHRARRYFMRNFDMTFQAYHRARRMGLALEQLRRGGDPLTVGLDHGFESASGFRDAFERTFGSTPGRSNWIVCIKTARIETPVGPLVAGATDEGVCLIEFADRRALQKQIATLRRRVGGAIVPGSNAYLDQLATELAEYFGGRRAEFSVKLVAPGSDFQRRVWDKLREIPFGATWSYEGLAREIGRPGAQRAVGRANGDNRIAILIPCHRVVRNDGTLCGYGGGLWRKQFLLDLERQSVARSGNPDRSLAV
ncbi:MAG: methylated-DNA--[protein]-cysteine S-methyltransferase [Phycisphaerales bacterium]|nr:methylated-DNA--[protein]-cysteine S-methyltransferase [Phycisphaerales bacterium]